MSYSRKVTEIIDSMEAQAAMLSRLPLMLQQDLVAQAPNQQASYTERADGLFASSEEEADVVFRFRELLQRIEEERRARNVVIQEQESTEVSGKGKGKA